MSSARQAVQRAESLTGLGKRPDLTPSHQQVFPRGMTLNTWGNRKNPVSGISNIFTSLLSALWHRSPTLAELCSLPLNIAWRGLIVAQIRTESRLDAIVQKPHPENG